MMFLIVLSSPSGSGKTYLAKILAERYRAEYLSFDDMKLRSHSDMTVKITQYLNEGKNVIADSLYDRVTQREELLQAVSKYSCRKVLYHLTTSLEECLLRNARREGKARLPDWVIESIYKTFENPTLSEGWDEIIIVKEDGSHETIHENNP